MSRMISNGAFIMSFSARSLSPVRSRREIGHVSLIYDSLVNYLVQQLGGSDVVYSWKTFKIWGCFADQPHTIKNSLGCDRYSWRPQPMALVPSHLPSQERHFFSISCGCGVGFRISARLTRSIWLSVLMQPYANSALACWYIRKLALGNQHLIGFRRLDPQSIT